MSKKEVQVEIVAAFTEGGSGGNYAGVVLDANELSTDQKLRVAYEVGLSETAFVSSSDIATIKLEFFTPTKQIAHCGHATIATFSRLRELNLIPEGTLSKETIDGNREIIVNGKNVYMEQKAPTYHEINIDSTDGRSVFDSLGIADTPSRVIGLSVINTGNSFLIVHLNSEDNVKNVRPDFEQISKISATYDLIGYYVFSMETRLPSRHAGARMFAPRYGIQEEAATGMAAGSLACYLYDKSGVSELTLMIEQGQLMTPASPSVINVNLSIDNMGRIHSLRAGGTAKSVKTITIKV